MSNPQALTYKLIVNREGRRRVGPAQDLERTAKDLAALYLEGFEISDVELVVGLIGRLPSAAEQKAVLARTVEVIQAT